jgi:hypothetical protein
MGSKTAITGFRLWLAKKIAPDIVARSYELDRVLSGISDAEQWLSDEYSGVGTVCHHLIAMHSSRMGQPLPPHRPWSAPITSVHDIGKVREWMRSQRAKP